MNEDDNPTLLHMTYSSTLVKQSTNYCVGIMRGGNLYINPIHSIYQMRPDFSHCNPNIDQDNKDDDANNNPIGTKKGTIVNCHIDHNKDNDDLYWNENTGRSTREFIKDKKQFEQNIFNQDGIYQNVSFEPIGTKIIVHHQYPFYNKNIEVLMKFLLVLHKQRQENYQ